MADWARVACRRRRRLHLSLRVRTHMPMASDVFAVALRTEDALMRGELCLCVSCVFVCVRSRRGPLRARPWYGGLAAAAVLA